MFCSSSPRPTRDGAVGGAFGIRAGTSGQRIAGVHARVDLPVALHHEAPHVALRHEAETKPRDRERDLGDREWDRGDRERDRGDREWYLDDRERDLDDQERDREGPPDAAVRTTPDIGTAGITPGMTRGATISASARSTT